MFRYLRSKHGENLHDLLVVTLSASSLDGCENCALNSTYSQQLGGWTFFQTEDSPGQWWQVDMREMKICPTHCTMGLRRSPEGPHINVPESLIMEGSMDGVKWTDFQAARSALSARHGNWKIYDLPASGSCRLFRIRMTGHNSDGNYRLSFEQIELFGTLYER
jgi:hypothetical protein